MIVGVAIMQGNVIFSLPKPNRHHDVINLINEKKGEFDQSGEQGFITDTGEFILRVPAGLHAIECGQIKELRWPPKLYSEDLW